VRLFAFEEGLEPDAAWVRARVARAARYRRETLGLPSERTTAFRAVHGEADGLPGVVADVLGGALVVEVATAGLERRKEALLDALEAEWRPSAVVETCDEATRAKEGLGKAGGLLRGALPEGGRVEVLENGARFEADLLAGQKTGFYCDQRENRARAADFARGRRVLDGFCYTGGFAVACARAGAASVEGIDTSAAAVEAARRNAARNEVGERASFAKGDVYEALGRARREGRRWDLVILDPPKYARSRADLEPALQKYCELFSLGASATAEGGVLVACTCSGLVDPGTFDDVLREAARDARRELRVIERRGQAPDHPQSVFAPEGRYLQAVFLHAP
jgi:23S rRNA (cytosine1962-C5)-methyltransferase